MMAALLLPVAAWADDAPSVLVQTIMPQRGSLPDTVTAYGAAEPAIDASMTLSIQSEGRVLDLAVTPGERVHAGDRLMDFAPSAQTISAYQRAVSALELAHRTRSHTAELLKQQLATRDQMAQAEKSVLDAQAALDALQHEGGGKTIATIKAPFNGIVTAIPVARGDRTAPGAPLLNLTRADGLIVTVGIEPADRERLHEGDAARLQPLTGADDATNGKVIRIDGMLNAKTRLIDADISAPPNAIVGEAFHAVITIGTFDGWLAPRAAVLTDAKGAYLFQVAAGKAVRVDVKILGRDGVTDAVAGPIDPQRSLVIEGNYQLSDGMAVRQGKPPS
jgi:RND family efflux transporter MFP subunit